jgi:hypothetical protein
MFKKKASVLRINDHRQLIKFEEKESINWSLNSNLIKVSPTKDISYYENSDRKHSVQKLIEKTGFVWGRNHFSLKQFQLKQVSKLTNACKLTIICCLVLFTRYLSENGSFCLPGKIKNLLILVHLMKLTHTAVCMDLLRLHNAGDDSVVKFFFKITYKEFYI